MLRSLIFVLLVILISACNAFRYDSIIPVAPVESTPNTNYFNVDSTLIDRGGSVTLSWEAHGVDRVAIEQYYGHKAGYDVRYDDLPPKGTLTVELVSSQPTSYAEPQPYIYGATFYLMPNDETGVYGDSEILAYTEVKIRCPYEGFFFGVDEYYADLCPLDSEHETEMNYQAFENGFMLQRADTETIYVFYINPDGRSGPAILFTDDQYAEFENSPDRSSEIPAGRYLTEDDFARVANSNHALVDGLGSAISAASQYGSTVQDTYAYAFFHPVVYMTLPDGQVIRYLTSAYTSGWSYID